MVYDLIIIGGGPAGVTAGIYSARLRLNALLITKGFGGQVGRKTVAIENWPGFEKISGFNLIQNFEKHLRKQEIDIERDEVVKIQKIEDKFLITTANKNKFESKTVIVASGADPRPLEVPGEKEFTGRGVSYCTACDGPVFSDKTVAVIGGGNSGFEAATFLSKIAKKIYILERGSEVGADKTNQARVKKVGKVEIIINAAVKTIEGDKFVNSITYQDLKTKQIKRIKVDGVFIEIGSYPSTSFARGLVKFNKRDEIEVEFESYQTETPGLFAAGDVNTGKYKQIVTAAGEGAKAAFAANDYLQKQT